MLRCDYNMLYKGSPVLAGTGVTCLVICICYFAVLKNFRVIDSRFENITDHIDQRDLSVFSPCERDQTFSKSSKLVGSYRGIKEFSSVKSKP